MSEWGTCSLPSPWKSRPGAEYWGPQHHTGLLTGRLCIVRFGAGCVAPWGPGIACVGVLDTLIPRPHWRPLLIPNHGGASLESFASIPRQNARVQDHFHRAHISFPAGTPPPPPAPTTLPKATSRLSWITTVKYYSVQFPIWPWLARIKLCMYFVWHRFYIVMMSYAKRKKN